MTTRMENLLFAGLVFAVTASAVAVVYSSHSSRRLTHDVFGERGLGVSLDAQQEQLMLDKAAWEAELRVDAMARSGFGMRAVRDEDVVVLRAVVRD